MSFRQLIMGEDRFSGCKTAIDYTSPDTPPRRHRGCEMGTYLGDKQKADNRNNKLTISVTHE
jgi:hypothetical protein